MNEAVPLRILFAPHEICGQMQLLAEGFRANGHAASAVSYSSSEAYGYVNDMCLHLDKRSRLGKAIAMLAFTRKAAKNYDIFHFFFGRSLLPKHLDLPLLKRLGKKIFVHFRGSDIRNRKWLTAVVEQQLLGRSAPRSTPRSTSTQVRRLEIWRRYADRIFVSIPELTEIAPDALVVQQAIDLCRWPHEPERNGSEPDEVVVAHATTNRKYKGTEYVVAAVESLRARGYSVRLDIIEGVPHKDVIHRFRQCHVGVDELLQGSYGNVAIELMALGRPVVANLGSWYSQNRPDLPIVNCGPDNLAGQLEELVVDIARRRRLGVEGRRYVEKWHDVKVLVDRLARIYQGVE